MAEKRCKECNGCNGEKVEKVREACKLLLFQSGAFLDLRSWKRLATVLRIAHSKKDAIMKSCSLSVGLERFDLWSKMLDERDGDSAQFKEMTEREEKEKRRRPRISYETLESASRDVEFKRYLEMAHGFETSTRLTPGVSGEIWRDVSRTLPSHSFFKEDGGIGQTMLGRILYGVAMACPQTGYCQGMNYLVAALLLGRLPAEITGGLSTVTEGSGCQSTMMANKESTTIVNERRKPVGILTDIIETFTADTHVLYEEDRLDSEFDIYMFVRRLENKGSKFSMIGMWEVGTPHMKLKVFQLESIMRWAVPRLHAHFEEIGFQPEILVSQWFMTHFSYMIPLDMLLRIWDYTFLMGWSGIYRISIALLMAMEERLLVFDLDDLGKAMRHFRTGVKNVIFDDLDLKGVLQRADSVLVTEGVLQQLQENFALEMISAAEVSMAAAIHKEAEQEKAEARERILEKENSASKSREGGLMNTLGAVKETVNNRVEEELLALSSTSTPSSGVRNKSLGALSGREATNWLIRYGDTLEGEKALEMLRIRDELKDMEVQIDMDKQSIQEKILHACEVCRAAEENFENAGIVKERMETKMAKLREMYATCMRNAGTLAAMAVSKIKRHEELYGDAPVTMEEFHEKHAKYNPDSYTPSKSKKDTSFSGSIDILLGGLSPSSSMRSFSGDGTFSTTSTSSASYTMESFDDGDSDLDDLDLSLAVEPASAEKVSAKDGDGDRSNGSCEMLNSVALSSESMMSLTSPRVSVSLTAALEAEIRRSAATLDCNNVDGLGESSTTQGDKEEQATTASVDSPRRLDSDSLSSPVHKQRGLLSSIKKSTRDSLKGVAISLGIGTASPQDDMSPSERELHEQLTSIGLETQKCQQNIIVINRSFTSTQMNLQRAHDWHTSASLTLEEASQWKKSLCDQLQLLVEDANRGRSQRLQFVANNYLF